MYILSLVDPEGYGVQAIQRSDSIELFSEMIGPGRNRHGPILLNIAYISSLVYI
jgi:hypothetical protein